MATNMVVMTKGEYETLAESLLKIHRLVSDAQASNIGSLSAIQRAMVWGKLKEDDINELWSANGDIGEELADAYSELTLALRDLNVDMDE